MKKTLLNKQNVIGLLSFLVVIGIFLVSIIPINGSLIFKKLKTEPTVTEPPATVTSIPDELLKFQSLLRDTNDQITHQEEVDNSLLSELKTGSYTFQNPLIVIDPYDMSPLTALVAFTTSEPQNISIHINGQDQYTGVDFTFDGFTQQHIIPVYGLYPGIENKVTITLKDTAGISETNTFKIITEPLPEDLAGQIILIDAPLKNKYQSGLNFTFGNARTIQKTAFDINGKFRWFLTNSYLNATEYKYGNRFVFAMGEDSLSEALLVEMNPLGRIYKIMYAPYGVHHDIEKYNEDLLLTGTNGNAIEDFIYEIDTQTGKISNTLDMKTIFQRSRQAGLVPIDNPDWFHNNAITWVEGQDKIIVSSRQQSLVAQISWPQGKIDWILGPHFGWLPMFDKYLLTPIGQPFDWQSNQHAPEILPDVDNNPETMDILLFDNGNLRFGESDIAKESNTAITQGFSRMVQYRINEKKMSVEQVWQFGKEYGIYFYSPSLGDANLLPNGNRLGVFDIAELKSDTNKVRNATFFEVTDQSQIVWSAQMVSQDATGNLSEYRLERMNIYNADANDLKIGTSAINLIPKEIMEKYDIVQK